MRMKTHMSSLNERRVEWQTINKTICANKKKKRTNTIQIFLMSIECITFVLGNFHKGKLTNKWVNEITYAISHKSNSHKSTQLLHLHEPNPSSLFPSLKPTYNPSTEANELLINGNIEQNHGTPAAIYTQLKHLKFKTNCCLKFIV